MFHHERNTGQLIVDLHFNFEGVHVEMGKNSVSIFVGKYFSLMLIFF